MSLSKEKSLPSRMPGSCNFLIAPEACLIKIRQIRKLIHFENRLQKVRHANRPAKAAVQLTGNLDRFPGLPN